MFDMKLTNHRLYPLLVQLWKIRDDAVKSADDESLALHLEIIHELLDDYNIDSYKSMLNSESNAENMVVSAIVILVQHVLDWCFITKQVRNVATDIRFSFKREVYQICQFFEEDGNNSQSEEETCQNDVHDKIIEPTAKTCQNVLHEQASKPDDPSPLEDCMDEDAASSYKNSSDEEVEVRLTRKKKPSKKVKKLSARPNFAKETKDVLIKWIYDHKTYPYPTREDKNLLCQQTGLVMSQLNDWFINNRRRLLKNNFVSFRSNKSKN
jgi:hypothetical protein